MWKPDESLDDYNVTPPSQVTSEPPPAVSLRLTGEIEVLKPLAEVHAEHSQTAYKVFRPEQPLWFRRFLAVGSGALVMIALVLVSAIFVGINDPTAGPDVARNGASDDTLAQPHEIFSFDVYNSPAMGEVYAVRANPRRRAARPNAQLAAKKSRRQSRPALQAEQPKFVPTTLIIYAENGVINTRIEPWLQTDDKKTPTFSN